MAFDIQNNPTVAFTNASGETRLAIANGVSEQGNPNLAVIRQVPNATYDENGGPDTWRYLKDGEREEIIAQSLPADESEAPETEAEPEAQPQPENQETSSEQ